MLRAPANRPTPVRAYNRTFHGAPHVAPPTHDPAPAQRNRHAMSRSGEDALARRCPTCRTAIGASADTRWRPFCPQRCKQVDLGAWLSASYRVPAVEQDDDEDLPPGEGPRGT